MKNHPLAAAVFAATMFIAIGWLAVSKTRENLESAAEAEAAERAMSPEAKELVRRIREAVQLGTEGELERAEERLAELADQYPNEALVWMNYGVALSGQEKFDPAIEAFERVLALRPRAWAAYGELATIHRLRDEIDEALTLLEKVPPGEGRVAERLFRDPIWRSVDDPRMEKLRRRHREVPETSIHVEDVTAKP